MATRIHRHEQLLVEPFRRANSHQIGLLLLVSALGLFAATGHAYALGVFGILAVIAFWRDWRASPDVPGAAFHELPDGSVLQGTIRTALRTFVGLAWLLVGVAVALIWSSPLLGAILGGAALGWGVRAALEARRVGRMERDGGWRLMCVVPRRWRIYNHSVLMGYRSRYPIAEDDASSHEPAERRDSEGRLEP